MPNVQRINCITAGLQPPRNSRDNHCEVVSLREESIEIPSRQTPDELHGRASDGNPDPEVTDPNAIEVGRSRHLFEIADLLKIIGGFSFFDHRSHTVEQLLIVDFLQVPAKTLGSQSS